MSKAYVRMTTMNPLQHNPPLNPLLTICLFATEQTWIAHNKTLFTIQTDGLTLPEFLSPVNPFRVEPIAPFFILCLFVLKLS